MSGRALVVGGGIAGLAAAVALRRRDWQVTLLERQSEISEVGAGISLWPNALRALDALGVGSRIRSLGIVSIPGGIRDSRGRWLARGGTDELVRRFGEGLVVLERRQLLGALRDACAEVDVRVATDVDTGTADGTVVTGSGDRLTGDLVVGADGLRSVVRGSLWPDSRVRSTGMLAARLIGRIDDPRPVAGGESWGRGDYCGVAPMPDGRLYAYLVVPVTAGAPSTPDEALPWLRERFASWHFPLPQLLAGLAPEHLLLNELHDLAPLPSLVHDRVALVGDAGHAITPNLGQGACQALEDAVELAACLAGPTDVAGRLLDYDRRRLPRVHQLARRSRTAGDVAAWRGLVSTTVRNTLVRLAPDNLALRGLESVLGWRPPAG